MFSLCAGGPAEEDDAAPVGAGDGGEGGAGVADGYADSSYRPGRALARELIDEAAMSPGGQVELPRGVSRSAYSVHTAKVVGAPGNSGAAPTLSSFTSSTFGRRGMGAGDTEESAHQAEVLGEELKKEGNALYNEGQVEAAELVYTEALKVCLLQACPCLEWVQRKEPRARVCGVCGARVALSRRTLSLSLHAARAA